MNFNIALSFLAAVSAVNGLEQVALRGTGSEARNLEVISTASGFSEKLGVCNGAVCGAWGDPHIVTCDGLKFNCMGVGLFTLLESHMFDIQATFVEVGHQEEKDLDKWNLPTASIMNDLVVNYKENDAVPKIQLGFGELIYQKNDDPIPSEIGCETGHTYLRPKGTLLYDEGIKKKTGFTLQECRTFCESKKDHRNKAMRCSIFQWQADGSCYTVHKDMEKRENPAHWARVLSGSLDSECGKPVAVDEIIPLMLTETEVEKHGVIGDVLCPLLMYLDNELVDISQKTNNGVGYLWGEEGDVNYVRQDGKTVSIVTEAAEGESSEIQLKLKGMGPGNKWSCHWDFFVCLPASEQQSFIENATGLLGSPDSNKANDWINPAGNILPISKQHVKMDEYCVDNWCVSQNKSMMTYHGEKDYRDYKCEAEVHEPFDPEVSCTYGAAKAVMYCNNLSSNTNGADVSSCMYDCCLGICPTDIPFTKLNDSDDDDDKPEFPVILGCPPETVLEYNKNSVCPNAGDPIVKLLKQTGVQDIPGDADIFYDIAFGTSPAGDSAVVNTVTFKINNPFPVKANVFVKHDKQALTTFVEPTCVMNEDSHGCDANTEDITAVCHKYEGVAPFALVQVYFVSEGVEDDGEQAIVDKCCNAETVLELGTGIVEYTFEVMCGCPETVA